MLDERFVGSDAEFAGHIRILGGQIYLDAINDASITISTSNSIEIVNLTGGLSIVVSDIILSTNLTTSTGLIKYDTDLSPFFDGLTLVHRDWAISYVASQIATTNRLDELTDVQISTGEPYDEDILFYDSGISKWRPIELPITFVVSASKNSVATDMYLYHEGTAMSVSPFVLPDDCYLKYMSASCYLASTWDAEVHINGVPVPTAVINIIANTKGYIKFSPPINFTAGDEIQLYCLGIGISKPKINAYFTTKPV